MKYCDTEATEIPETESVFIPTSLQIFLLSFVTNTISTMKISASASSLKPLVCYRICLSSVLLLPQPSSLVELLSYRNSVDQVASLALQFLKNDKSWKLCRKTAEIPHQFPRVF